MGLGDSYSTPTELKTYLRITDSADDALLTDSLATASRAIDHFCGRQFNKATSATARAFHPEQRGLLVKVDDFWTTSSLAIAVDGGNDGTYEQVLTTADYSLEPSNGVVDGESGWPFYRIRAVNTWFPCSVRPSVQVTAQWGWTAVPPGIKQACIYLAEEVYKLKGAPFGVASTDQFGPIRVRENPRVMAMLAPYRLDTILIA